METNYIKLNLPNAITITIVGFGMMFLVGAGARLFKQLRGG
jgi:hypothetical protein